jgi:1-acyl-sn-glycerol-3-phosphate acyltransferase
MIDSLRSIVFLFFTGLATFIGSIFAIISGIFNPYGWMVNGIIRNWAKFLLWVAGIKIEIQGTANLDPNQPYIYFVNHQSNFDILALSANIPGTVRYIAKKELFKVPFFGLGMKLAGVIKIDRSNKEEARNSINKDALDRINKGVSVIIFPEGTRSKDGKIHPFKKGGIILAIEGNIPIAPLVISGSFHIMDKSSLKLKRGKIKLEFLPPVRTEDYHYADRNELTKLIQQQITDSFDADYNNA